MNPRRKGTLAIASFLAAVFGHVFSFGNTVETWLAKNQEQNKSIFSVTYEAVTQCELYYSTAGSAYEKLPPELKEKLPKSIVDGDTFAQAHLQICFTSDGFFSSELNEVKTWKNVKHEQIRDGCCLVNGRYSLFWREGDPVIRRIDHVSPESLDSEEMLLLRLYGSFGYDEFSEYGLTPGPTLWEQYQQQKDTFWEAEKENERIVITTSRRGETIFKKILNPQKNFQIEQSLYYENGRVYEDTRILLQKITVSEREYWLPQEIHIQLYQPTHTDSSFLYKSKVITFTNIQINREIPEASFQLRASAHPEGTLLVRKDIQGKDIAFVLKDGRFISSDGEVLLE